MTRTREFLVGVVILTAITVGVLGTLWLQGRRWGAPPRPVDVLLTDVAQLSPGNGVKFRGVEIGQVASIVVEPDGQAVRVRMELEADMELPADAGVILVAESFFGDWQAEIVSQAAFQRFPFFDIAGAQQVPGVTLLPGYALPEMSRLTASAEQISENLATLSERLEIAFNDETAAQLAQAISNLEAISEEIRDMVAQQADFALSVTANTDSALAEIGEVARIARRSFERVEGILTDAQIDSIVTNVRLASSSIQEITGDLSGSGDELASALARADSTFARIDRLAARVESGEGAIGRLLSDSTLAVRAEDVLEQLDLLLEDLRENPRRYVRLSIF